MSVSAGDLNRRVTIQSRAATVDEIGEPNGAWSDVATVWANVADLSGREVIAARAVQAETVRRITIRYRTDIDSTMRVVYGSDVMVITAPPRMVGNKEWLELDCSMGLLDV